MLSCPLCGYEVIIDEETGLITFCSGCEDGSLGYLPNYVDDSIDGV